MPETTFSEGFRSMLAVLASFHLLFWKVEKNILGGIMGHFGILSTAPHPGMGNCIAVGRPRIYHNREKSALGFNTVLPN